MNTEMLGVKYVELAIAKTDYLVSHINTNDKEPSWDGDIEVYRKAGNNHAKADLILKVPVQVKGHFSNNLKKQTVTYPIEISDLRNFLEVGGTVFLVAYVDASGEKSQIYYIGLLPFELKKLLEKHGNQVTKNITLKALPKSKDDITNVFLAIARDMRKQKPAITCDPVTIEELTKAGQLKELSVGFSSIPKKDALPFDYFFDHGAYLYAKLPFGLELPVGHVDNLEAAHTTIEASVSVNGKQFYSSYEVIYKKETIELHFGKSTKFVQYRGEEKQTFLFNLSGTLSERIQDEEFIVEALSAGQFEVNETACSLREATPEELASFNTPHRREHLDWLKSVKRTLDELRVHKELDCTVLTPEDEQRLQLLKTAIIDKKPIPLNNPGSILGGYSVGNLKILVCAQPCEEGENLYEVCGFNDAKLDVKTEDRDGKEVPTSFYVLLKRDAILTSSNIDYAEMLHQIKQIPFSERFSEQVVFLLLELLHAYDASSPKDKTILSAAIELSKWLKDTDPYSPPEVLALNYYQALKRMRPLDEKDLKFLYSLIESKPKQEETYVGAYLLLDNQPLAQAHFELMDHQTKETMQSYPIFHFWKTGKEDN